MGQTTRKHVLSKELLETFLMYVNVCVWARVCKLIFINFIKQFKS